LKGEGPGRRCTFRGAARGRMTVPAGRAALPAAENVAPGYLGGPFVWKSPAGVSGTWCRLMSPSTM
jgi:hypothetical protein